MKLLILLLLWGCTQPSSQQPVTVNVQGPGTQTNTSTGMTFYQWLDMLNLNLSVTRTSGSQTAVGTFTCFIENAQFQTDNGQVTLSGTGSTADEAMKNYLALIVGKRMTVRNPTTGATNSYTVPFNLQP